MFVTFSILARMNHEVLYLVAVFVVGCTAITFRSIMFNLAGERFVARIRKQVYIILLINVLKILILLLCLLQKDSSIVSIHVVVW